MPLVERMTIDERRKYLDNMRRRNAKATRLEQGRLLDEMGAVTRPAGSPAGNGADVNDTEILHSACLTA